MKGATELDVGGPKGLLLEGACENGPPPSPPPPPTSPSMSESILFVVVAAAAAAVVGAVPKGFVLGTLLCELNGPLPNVFVEPEGCGPKGVTAGGPERVGAAKGLFLFVLALVVAVNVPPKGFEAEGLFPPPNGEDAGGCCQDGAGAFPPKEGTCGAGAAKAPPPNGLLGAALLLPKDGAGLF